MARARGRDKGAPREQPKVADPDYEGNSVPYPAPRLLIGSGSFPKSLPYPDFSPFWTLDEHPLVTKMI